MNGHPTPVGAVLYTVRGPRGSYFAVHDPANGKVFTERTDQLARDRARDQGLFVVSEEIISHEDLLRRTGRDADGGTRSSDSETRPTSDTSSDGNGVGGETVLAGPSPFPVDDTGESFVARRGGMDGALFSSHPLEPQYSDLSGDAMIWRNMPPVLNPPEEDWKAPERL